MKLLAFQKLTKFHKDVGGRIKILDTIPLEQPMEVPEDQKRRKAVKITGDHGGNCQKIDTA